MPEDAPGLVGRSFRAFGNHRLQNDGPNIAWRVISPLPHYAPIVGAAHLKYMRFLFIQSGMAVAEPTLPGN